MSQRNSHHDAIAMSRPAALGGALCLRGQLIIALVLVLLISNGGAG